MSSYGELLATNGFFRSVGEFGAPLPISTLSRLGSVTARHSSSGR